MFFRCAFRRLLLLLLLLRSERRTQQRAKTADWYSAAMTLRFAVGAVALLCVASLPLACTAVVTYPPTVGKSSFRPNVTPGPELMAAGIREANRSIGGGPIVFNLPDGLDAYTWKRVTELLPSGSRAMRPGDESVLSVQQLRLSGGQAEVDVLFPDRGVYQLMTVALTGGGFTQWRTKYAHRWVIPCTPPLANDPSIEMLATEGAAASTDTATPDSPAQE